MENIFSYEPNLKIEIGGNGIHLHGTAEKKWNQGG